MTEQVVHVVMYVAFFGLGFIAGCQFKRGGYWLGRLDEFDYCLNQGWFDLASFRHSPILRPDKRTPIVEKESGA
jgi:hypothetical protein